MQTFTTTVIIYYLLFFIVGYGGGAINKYYKPRMDDIYDFLWIIAALIFLNIIFYYIIVISIRKRFPPLYGVLHSMSVQYGMTDNVLSPFKIVNNRFVSKDDRHHFLNPKIKIPLYNYI